MHITTNILSLILIIITMIMIKHVHLLHVFVVISFVLCIKTRSLGSKSVHGDSKTAIRCIETERKALLDLKEGFSVEYDSLSSWGREEDKKECCKWEGVQCSNRTSHVTQLHLSFSLISIASKISPSLLVLQNLNYLNLSGNNFGGIPIPNFIGSLSKLVDLDLSSANFSGTIPNQLGNLSRLEHLDLHGNDFNPNHIPESIGSLTKLVFLDLSWANFNGAIPNQFGNLSRLELLNLGGNDFKRSPIPESIGSLTKLVFLDLYSTNFSGTVLFQLGNLSRLQHLDLSENFELSIKDGNLDWLSQLSSLTYLDMSNVDLSRANHWQEKVIMSLPLMIELVLRDCQLPNVMFPTLSLTNASKSIETLSLSDNNLTSSTYYWLFNMSSSLVYLDLSENMLKGSIPEAFTRMTSLEYLFLSSNELNGVIPIFLGNMTSLRYLHLNRNNLEGVISRGHLSNLLNLISLKLSYNNISFNLSSKLIFPFQLRELYLRSCKVGPRFPNWIQTQRKLNILDLSNTGIADSIPTWLWGVSSELISLNLSSNKIRGMLPHLNTTSEQKSELEKLRFFTIDLSSNCLEGPIPTFLFRTTSLKLSRNKFSGELSSVETNITGGGLEYLDVSHNLLFGEIPDCWMNFGQLLILNLAYNNFSGGIPSSLGFLVQLQVLDVHKNILHGELPMSLRNCTQLSFLDLGANNFSGHIPAWIGENLSKLYVLILQSNKFLSSIPLQLCNLRSLQFLDLSVNNIYGEVPQCFNNFTAMIRRAETPSEIVKHEYTQYDESYPFVDSALVVFKGEEYEYERNLGYVKSIDLSSNKLTGQLPETITLLQELVSFNISRNYISGCIPPGIGNMKALQSLDFSRNRISGRIPVSISNLTFLGFLDLSNNNLLGRIPTGTQLQSFDSAYVGNNALCGAPLAQKCLGDESSQVPSIHGGNERSPEGIDEFERWFVIGAAVGFSTTFWGICAALLLNHRWRHAYFLYLDKLKDWIVKVAVFLAKFPWKF